ncbi:hypothetical protein RRG08_040056 [Elysia crispata]|uniref:Uncharacterized protein n=1 Tax=Elysia crispata TaxID=231223 RepID=A0AAE0XWD5_9GAST|nr:hypothetical protein RRG08_040056 [Elysia crispata]
MPSRDSAGNTKQPVRPQLELSLAINDEKQVRPKLMEYLGSLSKYLLRFMEIECWRISGQEVSSFTASLRREEGPSA